ncbi:hypothetical protein K1719_021134 [Acacia pycnantha]|nr:hypothetical protein K1719_021134 [Acacia pycnantha]
MLWYRLVGWISNSYSYCALDLLYWVYSGLCALNLETPRSPIVNSHPDPLLRCPSASLGGSRILLKLSCNTRPRNHKNKGFLRSAYHPKSRFLVLFILVSLTPSSILDVVSRVLDYGHGHGHSKRSKMVITLFLIVKSMCLLMGRGRGRGRAAQNVERERETHHQELETEPCTSAMNSSEHNPDTYVGIDNGSEPKELPKDSNAVSDEGAQSVHNIDLNANLNENEDKNASTGTTVTDAPSMHDPPKPETKHEEISGWSLSDVDKMVIDRFLLQIDR